MNENKSLSVIIAAYNEEKNIQAAIESVLELANRRSFDYELLVFDDGSHDGTGEIIDHWALRNHRIKAIHNSRNCGLSSIAREGIRLAEKNYITWFPGDNSIEKESLGPILESIGKADIVIAYMANIRHRSFWRRNLSNLYTRILNLLFGLQLKYYNGATVFPTRLLKSLKLRSRGYEFFAELLIRSLKSNSSYLEVPFYNKPENERNSKALTWKNFLSLCATVIVLIKDIYFLRVPSGQQKVVFNV